MDLVSDVQFEHYRAPNTLGCDDKTPRLSWKISDAQGTFKQSSYEVEVVRIAPGQAKPTSRVIRCNSPDSKLVPWPLEEPLISREKVSIRIKVHDDEHGTSSPWSEPAVYETGLLDDTAWLCQRITAPWSLAATNSGTQPEQLFRKVFHLKPAVSVSQARLYITAQGVYEAELNGKRIGDYFLAPGWTSYAGRLQYQTYDVTAMLNGPGVANCLGVRVAEGWFSGRIGFEGGHRNIWGPHTALLAQLEIQYSNGSSQTVVTDGSWSSIEGPVRKAEIYDGEKYDATSEIESWSAADMPPNTQHQWEPVSVIAPLPDSTKLVAGYAEPVRRLDVLQPVEKITTPSGKTILDFGQNLVGFLRVKNMHGASGHKITLRHAEVLEHGELCTRPLRVCSATDEYTLKGSLEGEFWEPRFTFHGFRFAQVDNWPGAPSLDDVEAIVCHTVMTPAGDFTCSDVQLNKLYQNICWSMRDNFLSVPTDCPQRDERLGWSGDLAIFAPTAGLVYNCHNIIKNWLIDFEFDQYVLDGVPPMVSPNATLPDAKWCRRIPCAIWHDATILVPWALYQESGDVQILSQQYRSMTTWMKVVPKGKERLTHLWDPEPFQLGDWLDPAAPPDAPWKSATDARMIANMFLIQSLNLMARISKILGKEQEAADFEREEQAARAEFHDEYITPNGLITSDSQAAYAIAICFGILKPHQQERAADRLVRLVRKNEFKIGTGFAGTPYICEALVLTGQTQVAYSMLLEKKCPSWLYPVTMGATTMWERWDSMLPDGSVNPGEMTSFNHYALGAVAKFLYERIAGLQRLEPGWTKIRIAPSMGGEFTSARASHETRYGRVSATWETDLIKDTTHSFRISVSIPPGVSGEIVLPSGKEGDLDVREVDAGEWTFETRFERDYEWPVLPLPPKS